MDHPNTEATLAAGAAQHPVPDAQYDRMAPWEQENADVFNGPALYNVPQNTWESQCLFQARVVLTMPRPQIRRLVTPPLPQIGPRPPHHVPAPGIEAVIAESARMYPDNRAFFSGSPTSYSGTSRNSWGKDFG